MIPEQAILDLSIFEPYKIETWLHHIRRYQFVASFLKPTDRVLDVCCGSGFGASIMHSAVQSVKGIDKNKKAISFAQSKYPECEFSEQDILSYDYQEKYNVIVAFECLDHFPKNDGLEALSKLSDICQDMMFLSLPQDQRLGINSYHLAEWKEAELKLELERYFRRVMLFGQSWASGQIYFPYEERHSITVLMAIK